MPAKIRKRGNNTFELCVSCGTDDRGRQKLARKTVHCLQKEVEKQYSLFLAEVTQGKVLTYGKERMTIQEFYAYWKHHYCETNNEVTTVAYNDALFTRIDAALGHLRIDKVQPRHILAFLEQLRAPDAGHLNKPLSSNTLRKHFVLLKTLFNAAKKWQYILSNPCDNVEAPKQEKSKKRILSEPEMARFLSLLAIHKVMKHKLWVYLSFTGGLRREEIFGLKWKDFDTEKCAVTIERAAVYVAGTGIVLKDTKSDNSQRVVSLPQDVMYLLEVYKQEVRDNAKRRNKRQKVVNITDHCAPEMWVFPKLDGSIGHPHSFNSFIKRFCANNGIPAIGPHTFRHMHGSYLIRSGVDLAAVSAKLGHASNSFTANTYIHALQSAEKQSAIVMQGILDNLKTGIKKEG
jgi:integrase